RFSAGTEGQLDVSPMHRIAGLERDNPAPALAAKLPTQVGWRQAQRFEIVAGRRLHTFQTPSNVPWMRFVEQIVDAGMNNAGSIEYALRFFSTIRFPHFFSVQQRQHHAFGISQRYLASTAGEGFCEIL